jgi:anti-anti-sigma factor
VEVRTVHAGAVLHVTVQGELDADNHVDFFMVVHQAITPEVQSVVVHGERLRFIDCAAVGTLLRLSARMRGRGGNLLLVGSQPNIQRMLEILGLRPVLSPKDTPTPPRPQASQQGLQLRAGSGDVTTLQRHRAHSEGQGCAGPEDRAALDSGEGGLGGGAVPLDGHQGVTGAELKEPGRPGAGSTSVVPGRLRLPDVHGLLRTERGPAPGGAGPPGPPPRLGWAGSVFAEGVQR